jgi:lauroyl/myristoyl acyltransferase
MLEQDDYAILDYVETEGVDDALIELLQKKPVVICTFHTGSYRVLNLFLCRHTIPYSLVVGKEVAEKEGQLFASFYQQLPGNKSNDGFKVIDAEASNCGLQMLRELKKGRSLLLYIDGNTGAGANTTINDNACAVDFLNQQLYARKGIAYLAHMAKVPLLTVASYRKNIETICLKFFAIIEPDERQGSEEFAVEATQLIYKKLAAIVEQYPEQWEGWLYIHKVAHIIHVPLPKQNEEQELSSQKISFDSTRFGIFKANEKHFLLKKHAYSFFEISVQLYDVLISCVDTAIDKSCLSADQLQQLKEEGVITYV